VRENALLSAAKTLKSISMDWDASLQVTRRHKTRRAALAASVGMAWVVSLHAATPGAETPAGNPYSAIPERNAFGIKPPPPPPAPEPVVAPPPPPSNIYLTGVSHVHGRRLAYLVVNAPGGKGQKNLTVDDAYDADGIKVLGINPKEGTVKILNGTVEQTLNFKDNGMKGTGAPAPQPGGPPGLQPPGGPRPITYQPPTHSGGQQGDGPTIIGRKRMREEADALGAAQQAVQGNYQTGLDPGVRELPQPVQAFPTPLQESVSVAQPGSSSAGQTANANAASGADPVHTVPAVPGQVSNPTGRQAPPIPGR
jgi:hypothetical protein